MGGFARNLRSLEEKQLNGINAASSTPIDWESEAGKKIKSLQRRKRMLFESPLPQFLGMQVNRSGRKELRLWSDVHSEIQTGISAIASSQITLTWTAFELLASDLWVAAVNWQPNPLAVQFADSNAQVKSLSISTLAAYGNHDFNLNGVMGDVLRDTKADFVSLKSTKSTYDRTFNTAVRAFECPDLRLLELLRNLILHKALITDRKFLKCLSDEGIKKSFPMIASVQSGEVFPIDRSLVRKLIESAVTQGEQLVSFVKSYFWPS